MKEGDIINNYDRLPIGKTLDIQKVMKDESRDEVQKQVGIIAILADITEEDVLTMPLEDYHQLAVQSHFLDDAPPMTKRLANTYICGGYQLIPTKDARKITTAQYVDFQSYCKLGFMEHLAEVLSCLLIPKGKKYNTDYDIVAVQDAIRRDMSTTDAVSVFGFFLMSSAQSIANTLNYCKQEIMKLPKQEQREVLMKRILAVMPSQTNGDGYPLWMQ